MVRSIVASSFVKLQLPTGMVAVRVRQAFEVLPTQEPYAGEVAQNRWSFMVVYFRR